MWLFHFALFIISDECQSKYGNANAWKYCCRVFDFLTVAAVCFTKLHKVKNNFK